MKWEIYYFTSKIEIKPQPTSVPLNCSLIILHQRLKSNHNITMTQLIIRFIILHQRLKSNHNYKCNYAFTHINYFTSKIEIKPQLLRNKLGELLELFYIKDRNQTTTQHLQWSCQLYYFTSKIEIKPQRRDGVSPCWSDYFTSKIEIKPQPVVVNHGTQFLQSLPQK